MTRYALGVPGPGCHKAERPLVVVVVVVVVGGAVVVVNEGEH